MKTAQHTPGPWHWTNEFPARDLSDTWTLVGPDGYSILVCDGLKNSPSEFYPDNACLIAAAPEMFDVLVMIRDADDDCRRDGLPKIPGAARAKIDAAIAKAMGAPA